jgi:hypothetical protein
MHLKAWRREEKSRLERRNPVWRTGEPYNESEIGECQIGGASLRRELSLCASDDRERE